MVLGWASVVRSLGVVSHFCQPAASFVAPTLRKVEPGLARFYSAAEENKLTRREIKVIRKSLTDTRQRDPPFGLMKSWDAEQRLQSLGMTGPLTPVTATVVEYDYMALGGPTSCEGDSLQS